MGPYLYPDNPNAEVTSESWVGLWAKRRHQMEARYLNWAAKESDMASHVRRAVDQACIYGRGVLWPVYNPRKNLVHLVWEDVKNVTVDPHARIPEEARYWVRKRRKPRFELMAKFPERKAEIRRLPAVDGKGGAGKASDVVEYQEVYLSTPITDYDDKLGSLEKVAMQVQRQQTEPEEGLPMPMQAPEPLLSQGPRKYTLAGDVLLGDDVWEFPLFQDDMPPCVFIDLSTLGTTCLWPRAPMRSGLGHLKALKEAAAA
jgi:hypothetical protein